MGVERSLDTSTILYRELANSLPGKLWSWLYRVGQDSLDSSFVEDGVAHTYHRHHRGGEEQGGEGVGDAGPEVAQ